MRVVCNSFMKKKKSQKTTTTSSLESDKVHDALTRYARFWLLEKTCWAFSFSYYVHEIVVVENMNETERAGAFSQAQHTILSSQFTTRSVICSLFSPAEVDMNMEQFCLSFFRLSSYTTYICPLFGALRMSHGTGRACFLVRHNTLLLCVCCAPQRWKAIRQKTILNRISMLWVLPVPRQLTLWSCS